MPKTTSPNFAEKVYALCQKIPRGKVTTYGAIARALHTKAYRAVGQALKCNPYAHGVPCHRVVRSDGSVGGFKGKTEGKEVEEKIKMLKKEGVRVEKYKVDLKNVMRIKV
ncbi:MAG: MGMT family protein [Nanoarchaeota archaeon]